jgi:hypothetical protein
MKVFWTSLQSSFSSEPHSPLHPIFALLHYRAFELNSMMFILFTISKIMRKSNDKFGWSVSNAAVYIAETIIGEYEIDKLAL